MYNEIRNLSDEQARAAWLTLVVKGDKFCIDDEKFIVTTKTSKTLRIKSNKRTFSFTFYRTNDLHGNNAATNFLRDVAGILRNDLLQEYNTFHVPSDIFKMTANAIRKERTT